MQQTTSITFKSRRRESIEHLLGGLIDNPREAGNAGNMRRKDLMACITS
jgi:hypothetical protein